MKKNKIVIALFALFLIGAILVGVSKINTYNENKKIISTYENKISTIYATFVAEKNNNKKIDGLNELLKDYEIYKISDTKPGIDSKYTDKIALMKGYFTKINDKIIADNTLKGVNTIKDEAKLMDFQLNIKNVLATIKNERSSVYTDAQVTAYEGTLGAIDSSYEARLKIIWKAQLDADEAVKAKEAEIVKNTNNNTYETRFGKVNAITCPQFQFNYSNNWKVTNEEINNVAFSERDIITNSKKTKITYMNFASVNGLGNDGRMMYRVEASKVAYSSFIPTIPVGTDSNYSNVGNFIVAKLKIVGELNMDKDSDYTPINGNVLYAVVPESYVGIHEAVGMGGLYTEFSFKYPGLYAFIAETSDVKFKEDEEKEVITILASFKTK